MEITKTSWYLWAHLLRSTRRVQFWLRLWLGNCTGCAEWAFWWRCSGQGRLRKGAWWTLWRIKHLGIARWDTGTPEVAMLNLKRTVLIIDKRKKIVFTNRFYRESTNTTIYLICFMFYALVTLPNLFNLKLFHSSLSCQCRPFNQISKRYCLSKEMVFIDWEASPMPMIM